MGEYAASISVWEHEIGGIKHRLVPTKETNLRLIDLKERAQKANKESILLLGVQDIYFDLVLAQKPGMSEDDKKELKDWIGVYVGQIFNEMMIAFKWTTKEELDKAKAAIFAGASGKNQLAG